VKFLKAIWFAQIGGWHVIPLGIVIGLGIITISIATAHYIEVIWPIPLK